MSSRAQRVKRELVVQRFGTSLGNLYRQLSDLQLRAKVRVITPDDLDHFIDGIALLIGECHRIHHPELISAIRGCCIPPMTVTCGATTEVRLLPSGFHIARVGMSRSDRMHFDKRYLGVHALSTQRIVPHWASDGFARWPVPLLDAWQEYPKAAFVQSAS